MANMVRAFFLVSILVGLLFSRAEAAPFAPGQIPASAEGIIHVDLDRLWASQLWREVKAIVPAQATKELKEEVTGELVGDLKQHSAEVVDLVAKILGSAHGIT